MTCPFQYHCLCDLYEELRICPLHKTHECSCSACDCCKARVSCQCDRLIAKDHCATCLLKSCECLPVMRAKPCTYCESEYACVCASLIDAGYCPYCLRTRCDSEACDKASHAASNPSKQNTPSITRDDASSDAATKEERPQD